MEDVCLPSSTRTLSTGYHRGTARAAYRPTVVQIARRRKREREKPTGMSPAPQNGGARRTKKHCTQRSKAPGVEDDRWCSGSWFSWHDVGRYRRTCRYPGPPRQLSCLSRSGSWHVEKSYSCMVWVESELATMRVVSPSCQIAKGLER